MKIKKYIYILCGRDSNSRPFVSDVLHDSSDEYEHLGEIGLDVVGVKSVTIDLSNYEH